MVNWEYARFALLALCHSNSNENKHDTLPYNGLIKQSCGRNFVGWQFAATTTATRPAATAIIVIKTEYRSGRPKWPLATHVIKSWLVSLR